MPADLLIYGSSDREEVQLALCIDGELSDRHDLPLHRHDVAERLGITVGPPAERPLMPKSLEEVRVGREEIEHLSESVEADRPSTEPPERRSEIKDLAVRSISVFEHSELLAKVLESARERLLIISPWVRRAVVDANFVASLERRIRAGVIVHIAHGIGADDRGSDQEALERLSKLASRYPGKFTFVRLRNTHAKILISDDVWVSTSFNWLSFKGDPDRTYRMEEGTLVSIPEEVGRAYSRYLSLIAEQGVV